MAYLKTTKHNEPIINKKDIDLTCEQLLDTKGVCSLLHISKSTLDKWCMDNKIEYYKLGNANSKRVFRISEIERFLNTCRVSN